MLLLATSLRAQVNVPPGNVSGTWSASAGPYLINGPVHVSAGDSLVLLPGTELQFAQDAYLRVFGFLGAEGTASDSIVFTSGSGTNWQGVFLDSVFNTSQSTSFKYCRFNNSQVHCLVVKDLPLVQVSNCLFLANTQLSRGALYGKNCGLFSADNNFIGNISSTGNGGAIHLVSSSATIFNNSFEQNTAASKGGAIYFNGSGTINISSQFALNTAAEGGACYFSGGGLVNISDAVFNDNTANVRAGGIYCDSVSRLNLLRASFSYNSSASGAAGVYASVNSRVNMELVTFTNNMNTPVVFDKKSTAVIQKTLFENNFSQTGSGACVFDSVSVVLVINSLFHNNEGVNGGAISSINHSAPDFFNCTLAQNLAQAVLNGKGGAIYLRNHGAINGVNVVIYGNEDGFGSDLLFAENLPNAPCTVAFRNCVLQGLDTFIVNIGGLTSSFIQNTSDDPIFLVPAPNAGYNLSPFFTDYRLQVPNSAAINYGTTDTSGLALGQTDFTGSQNRIVGDTIDAGAYETILAPTPLFNQTFFSACEGDTLMLIPAFSGITPMNYIWYFDGNGVSTDDTLLIPEADSLQSGMYTCAAANNYGGAQQFFWVGITPAPELDVLVVQNEQCSGSCDGIAYAQSNATYFEWGVSGIHTQTNFELCEGIYTCTAVQAGCSSTDTFQVAAGAPLPELTVQADTIICAGSGTASIQLSGTGGNGQLIFALDTNYSITGLFQNLFAGAYPVFVYDTLNCADSDTVIISEALPVQLLPLFVTDASCGICNDGQASYQVLNGIGTLSFYLDSILVPAAGANNIPPGLHSLCVTDALGCSVCDSFFISFPTAISFEMYVPDDDGLFKNLLNGNFKNEPFYVCNLNGQMVYHSDMSTHTIHELKPGLYMVFFTDRFGTIQAFKFTITE